MKIVLVIVLILGALLFCFHLVTAIGSYLAVEFFIREGMPAGGGDLASMYTSKANIVSTGTIAIANLILVIITLMYVNQTRRMADAMYQSRVEGMKPLFVPMPKDSGMNEDGYHMVDCDHAEFIFVNIGNSAVSFKCTVPYWANKDSPEFSVESIRIYNNVPVKTGPMERMLLWPPDLRRGDSTEAERNLAAAKAIFSLSYYDMLGNRYEQKIPFILVGEHFDFDKNCYPAPI